MSSVADIRIDAVPEYCADESRPSENRHVFRYTITVHNGTDETVQLLARYWKITQGSGDEQEVRGKGVVGKQPLIAPGELPLYLTRRARHAGRRDAGGLYLL